jgi:uncharacterized protein YcnI
VGDDDSGGGGVDRNDPAVARRVRRALRLAAIVLLPAAAAASAAPAHAHVTLQPGESVAGTTTTLQLAIEHGCDGSSTTALAVRIPDGVAVTPLDDAQWEASENAGSPATLTFRAVTPIPDGHAASVAFTADLPDEAGVLVFPTVQSCENGELAWLEATADGTADDSFELPAPTLRVIAADGAGSVDGGGPGVALGVVGVGVLGSAVVGGVLARQRRRP